MARDKSSRGLASIELMKTDQERSERQCAGAACCALQVEAERRYAITRQMSSSP